MHVDQKNQVLLAIVYPYQYASQAEYFRLPLSLEVLPYSSYIAERIAKVC